MLMGTYWGWRLEGAGSSAGVSPKLSHKYIVPKGEVYPLLFQERRERPLVAAISGTNSPAQGTINAFVFGGTIQGSEVNNNNKNHLIPAAECRLTALRSLTCKNRGLSS